MNNICKIHVPNNFELYNDNFDCILLSKPKKRKKENTVLSNNSSPYLWGAKSKNEDLIFKFLISNENLKLYEFIRMAYEHAIQRSGYGGPPIHDLYFKFSNIVYYIHNSTIIDLKIKRKYIYVTIFIPYFEIKNLSI